MSSNNPLGRYAAIATALIALFWIGLTGIVDAGLVKGDPSTLNPVALLILGVIFGTSVSTTTLNGTKAQVASLIATAADHSAQITALAAVVPVAIAKAATQAVIAATPTLAQAATDAVNAASITAAKIVAQAVLDATPCDPAVPFTGQPPTPLSL